MENKSHYPSKSKSLEEYKEIEVQIARFFALIKEKEIFLLIKTINSKSLSHFVMSVKNVGGFKVMFLKAVAVADLSGKFNIEMKFNTNKSLIIYLVKVFNWAASICPLRVAEALRCTVSINLSSTCTVFGSSNYPVIICDIQCYYKRLALKLFNTFDRVMLINKCFTKNSVKFIVHSKAN